MDNIDCFLVMIIAMVFSFTIGGIFADYTSDASVMGQMICDEQYGAGNTTYKNTVKLGSGEHVVECREVPDVEVPDVEVFDGEYTRIISNKGE